MAWLLEQAGFGVRLPAWWTGHATKQKLEVTAKVQGSRPTPYAVTIQIPQLGDKDWEKLVVELNAQAVFAAKLLAGEMPQDIETAFTKAGLSLFPKSLKEIETSCSCPDFSNPCKHIAAVYYLLGEEFDRDPFLLFRLRGTDRDRICGRLSTTSYAKTLATEKATAPAVPPDPLPSDAAVFWASPSLPSDLCGEVRLPPVSAAGPKRLGGFPFCRGTDRFLEAITPSYSAAAQRGLAVFESETSSLSEGSPSSPI